MEMFYERLKLVRNASGQPESAAGEVIVHETVEALLSQPTDAQRPGMLLGKIQSGKTRSFLGIILSAFDNGFDVAIVLTKGTRTLAKQTVNRIAKEYSVFRDAEQLAVYDIMSIPNLTEWEIEDQKLVFVAKKEHNNMRRLTKLFQETHPSLAKKRVLIVDDEADFASIRFAKKKDTNGIGQGRIADQIDELRRVLTTPAVLQVTATPYSLYLQPDEYDPQPDADFTFEPKRPAFTKLVPIHTGYVGGDEYFGEHEDTKPEYYLWHEVDPNELLVLKKEDRRRIKKTDVLTSEKIRSLRHAIVAFVAAGCLRRLQQRAAKETLRRYAMIVHIETARSSHAWQEKIAAEVVEAMGDAAKAKSTIFSELRDSAIKDLSRSVRAEGLDMPPLEDIASAISDAFGRGQVVLERVNSDNDVEALLDENAELRLRTPFNIFIGGQILDRGITVPNLIAFYYGRSPKRMQQDTVLQHARMYGNRPRPDLAVTRFYTTAHNYLALRMVHEFDSALRYAFESGAHNRGVAFVVKDAENRVIPCAPGKIMMSNITALRPGRAHLPFGFNTVSKTVIKPINNKLDSLIPIDAIDTKTPVKVPTETAIEILDLIEASLQFELGYDFDWNACRAAIEYFSYIAAPAAERGFCWIIAMTGRTLRRKRLEGRFSDSPHTYQDRAIINSIDGGLPILLLLRQEGREADQWREAPFWWPVLFPPATAAPSIFASSITPDEQA
jgi:hypothetical protein